MRCAAASAPSICCSSAPRTNWACFESGLTAQLFGPVASVVAGGVGTLLVVAAVAMRWPEMRSLSTLREPLQSPDA